MGILKRLMPETEQDMEKKEMIEAEKRQLQHSEDHTVTASALDANDDQNYILSQDRKSDLIRWQQELEPDMFQMVMTLQSLQQTEDGKIVPIYSGKTIIPPLCNGLFINQVILPTWRAIMSKNLINSNLDKATILALQRNTADDITNAMADNYDKYGIDFVNYDIVMRDIKTVIVASVWRSYKGWTMKTNSSMIKRIEKEQYGEEEDGRKKRSLFSS